MTPPTPGVPRQRHAEDQRLHGCLQICTDAADGGAETGTAFARAIREMQHPGAVAMVVGKITGKPWVFIGFSEEFLAKSCGGWVGFTLSQPELSLVLIVVTPVAIGSFVRSANIC